MPRYIDADDYIKYCEEKWIPLNVDAVKAQPTADVVEIKKDGEWEMFDLISSAYYGKGMYFKQDNGIVYSRYSNNYMSVDEAIREFVSLIDGSDVVEVVRCKECGIRLKDGYCPIGTFGAVQGLHTLLDELEGRRAGLR